MRFATLTVLIALACGCDSGTAARASLIDQLEGTWSGHHVDQTNDVSESVTLTITKLDEASARVVVDVGPRGGGPDPAPAELTLALDDESLSFEAFDAFLGRLAGTIDEAGVIVVTSDALGYAIRVDGTLDAEGGRLELFPFVMREGAFAWQGRAVLCRDGADGCEPTEPIPFTTDCAIVPTVATAGEDCTAECVPPNGACVGGTCLQVCIPSECESLCGGDETCIRIEDGDVQVTFSDGRALGGCSPDTPGPYGEYEACNASNPCAADLKCFTLGEGQEGICVPPCTADDDCAPGPGGEPSGCDLYSESTNRRFCALRCTATEDASVGDAQCPAPLRCQPSPVGGTCL